MAVPTRTSADKNIADDINDLQTQITAGGGGSIGFFIKGNIYVDTDIAGYLSGISGTITKVRAYADTAPTGAAIEVDINKNGVSIMSSVLEIAAGANSGTSTSISTPSFVAGDRITMDVDQIGSTIGGGNNFYVTIEL